MVEAVAKVVPEERAQEICQEAVGVVYSLVNLRSKNNAEKFLYLLAIDAYTSEGLDTITREAYQFENKGE